MSRTNTIQVSLSDYELKLIRALAAASRDSISNAARRRLFGAGPFVRAYLATDLAEAQALSEVYGAARDTDPHWPLTLLRLHMGVESDVFEVFEGREMQPGKRLTLAPSARLVLAGSPWPYRVLEDYSWSSVTEASTVLRLAPCHTERAYSEKVVPLAAEQ